MRAVIVALALCAGACAFDTEQLCNYTATGDETNENAVPISTFRTSGLDFVRPAWCITHCKDRKSIKAEMLFQPANASSVAFKYRAHRRTDGTRSFNVSPVKGDAMPISKDSDNTFCVDPTVAATVDAIFDKYTTIDDISEALNYYINKPGWAYLVYQMGPPPSIVSTVNVHTDVNFCMKNIVKQTANGFAEYQLFSGYVGGGL